MDDESDRLNTIHSILVCLSKVKPDFKGVCGLVDIFYWPVFFFFSPLWQFYLQICIIFSRFSFFFCICEASLTQTWFWNPFFFPPSFWPLWELRPRGHAYVFFFSTSIHYIHMLGRYTNFNDCLTGVYNVISWI